MHINFELLGFSQAEWEQRNELVRMDMMLKTLAPFSAEAFKKTDHERAALTTAKHKWKKEVRAAGLDPKRVINAPFMH